MRVLREGYEIDGRWKVQKRLGKGGMGAVYLCHDLQDPDALFAVKALLKVDVEDGDPENRVRRFHREARILAELEHPVIVRYEGFGTDEHCHYIVMEHIDGDHLEALCIKRAAMSNLPLPPDTSIEIVRDVASAVAAAHAAGVFHRDLKLENVMWAPDKGTKLVDFGIATTSDPTAKLTQTGFAVGTARYLPPEVFFPEDGREADPALTDVYALGVVLHECLTGNKAFATGHVDALKAGTPHLDPGEDYPDNWRQVVRSATARDPEQRTPSVAALLEGLNDLRPVDDPSEPVEDGWMVYLVGALLAVGAALAVFAVAIGLGLVLWPDGEPEPDPPNEVVSVDEPDPEPEPERELELDPEPEADGNDARVTTAPAAPSPPVRETCPPRDEVLVAIDGSYESDLWPCVIQAFNQTANEVEKRKLGARVWSVEHGRCASGAGCANFELFAPLFLEDATQSDPDLILQWIEHVHRKDLAPYRDEIPKLVTNRIYEASSKEWTGRERVDKLDRAYRVYAEHMARHGDSAVDIAQAAEDWCELQRSSEIADSRCLEICEGVLDTERCLTRMPYMAPVQVSCASNPRGAAEGRIGGESCSEARPLRVGSYRLTMSNADGEHHRDIVVLHGKPALWVWRADNGSFEEKSL